jgi:superfamily II DNA/RNA helicase
VHQDLLVDTRHLLSGLKILADDFSGLGLSEKVTAAVAASGYTKPTDIQAQAIPLVLQKRDIIGIAQTGTGKTASFVLPMLTLLESGRARARMPRTLILEPTRELAAQVAENFEKYGKNHKLNMALLIGGVSFDDQIKKLDRGVDVLIATPGRMLDLFDGGRFLLTGVDIFVIDEADRMLDMGFIDDIKKIGSLLPPRRQTLLFSATMPPEIQKLVNQFLRDPVKLEVARQNSTAETIDQKLVKVGSKPEEKREALRDQIRASVNLTNAIIFCNRKRDIDTLARSLQRHGFSVGALHGDMDQKNRTDTLEQFKTNKITLLVASDVAARGLDIPAVSHVFNFDVPVHAEDYVHRIGRTGRAGRSGSAITLVAPSDGKHVDAITKLIQRDIEWMTSTATPQKSISRNPNPDEENGEEPRAASESRRPARSRRGNPAARQAERQPERQAEPPAERAPQAEKPRQERPRTQAARPARPAPEPRKPSNSAKDTGIDVNSPFGSDGPVPAFLLRFTLPGN